jgi:4-amino-4-deoxy-L-arabinose transferase-like glycosyltransferase
LRSRAGILPVPVAAIVLVTALAVVLRAQASPLGHHHLSQDEQSYGRIALALASSGDYGDPAMPDATRWAPGAPFAFAAAHAALPGPAPRRAYEVPEARTLNVAVGAGTVLAVFAAAAMLAGAWTGVVAGAAVALYPPLVAVTRYQLTEPLGALLLALAVAALVPAARGRPWGSPGVALVPAARGRPWAWPAVAGALLGATVLVRADLLLTPLIAAAAIAWARRGDGRRAALGAGSVVLAASLALIAPWAVFASVHRHHVVPVSDGGPGTLFIGTYLPGGGTLHGFKTELAPLARADHRSLRDAPVRKVPAAVVLSAVARREAGVPYASSLRGDARNRALTRAALRNLQTYAIGRPGPYARMMLAKAGRLWLHPFQEGAADGVALHLGLVALAVAGLAAGLWLRRDPVLLAVAGIVAYSTLDNMVLVSEPRHNLPLLPSLIAVGAAGLAWAIRRRRPAAGPPSGARSGTAP